MIDLLKDTLLHSELFIITAGVESPSTNMGQKMSALRREVRGVKDDAHVQCERDIDGSLSRVTSSEDECAVPSSNMIESV